MSARAMLRTTVSHAALLAGLAVVAVPVAAPPAARAQAPAPATTPATTGEATALPTLSVQGAAPPNTLQAPTGVSRLPNTVQDTPQTINVVPAEVLRQQNVTTLEEALRNVPGITASAGEGNGGSSGDQFRIRGFNAQNDLYVDGLRDFGTYQRDAFTFEEVSVLKGPSGYALGGAGTVGGGVNVTSRTATLGNHVRGVATGGMGPFARGTADVNVQVGESSAVRLNLMGQSFNVVDRDELSGRRWGVAPSVAFGLGADTTLSVEYLHYEYNQVTDSGIPLVFPRTGLGRPASEYGVRRANWYGIQNDEDDVRVDRITARLSHRVSDWLTVANDFRTGWVNRDFAYSVPNCGTATGAGYADSCSGRFFRGLDPALTYGGGSSPYTQDNWSIQNIATATARFNTGPLRHQLVAGIDYSREENERTGFGYSQARTAETLLSPQRFRSLAVGAASNQRDTDIDTFALFANERLWLIPEVSLVGGLRWTHYEIDYRAGTPGLAPSTRIGTSDSFVDPTASIVFEPTPAQTYYFSYSASTTPPGANFTTLPASVSPNVEPERNQNFEIGGKIGLFENRLGLYAALFHTNKRNATEQLADGTTFQTSDRQRVRGAEIGLTGRITGNWNINAAYTFLDTEITRSTTAANVGNRVQLAPRHAASLWTTYDILPESAYNLTVGAGITYRSRVYLNAANVSVAPENFSLDALVSHRINDNLRVSVNGYNLTDRTNYGAVFQSRAQVSAGRTVLASLSFDF